MIVEDKTVAAQESQEDRRTELAVLAMLIKRYPKEAKEKVQKLLHNSDTLPPQTKKPLA